MKKSSIIISIAIIVVTVAIAGGTFFYYQQSSTSKTINQSETQNVQQEQAPQQQPQANNTQPTPNQQTTKPDSGLSIVSWKTFKDNYGFQMQYYPDANIMGVPTSKTITCDSACPSTLKVGGITSAYASQTINDTNYCIYSGKSSAAGSSHNEYLFVTVKNNVCYGIDVSYSQVNCDNYGDASAKQDCLSKETKNMGIVSKALTTIEFKK
jgi:cytoskeletal protein RodZ